MSTMEKVLLRGALTGIVAGLILTGMGWALLGWALLEGLNREADRQDAVRQYNCTHYGAAINKHYGQDLCPSNGGNE